MNVCEVCGRALRREHHLLVTLSRAVCDEDAIVTTGVELDARGLFCVECADKAEAAIREAVAPILTGAA